MTAKSLTKTSSKRIRTWYTDLGLALHAAGVLEDKDVSDLPLTEEASNETPAEAPAAPAAPAPAATPAAPAAPAAPPAALPPQSPALQSPMPAAFPAATTGNPTQVQPGTPPTSAAPATMPAASSTPAAPAAAPAAVPPMPTNTLTNTLQELYATVPNSAAIVNYALQTFQVSGLGDVKPEQEALFLQHLEYAKQQYAN